MKTGRRCKTKNVRRASQSSTTRGIATYVGTDVPTFRVSFADNILGLNVDVFLSKKTVMLLTKSSNNPCVKRKQTWEEIESIFNNLYNYA